MKRFVALHVAPVVALLVITFWPLMSGAKTLFLRDVLQTHFMNRISLVEALREGRMPLVDPLRAGGQALAGNLNALPFYPGNLLALFGDLFWGFNAHFWLHALVALWAAYWMGRAWGLDRAAAWATATVYATSGFFLSTFNLYNMVAGAALAPALVAAALESGAPPTRRRGILAAGLLWALLVLAGEPLLALLALLLALAARSIRDGWRTLLDGRFALALLAGTLVAAPQIVETARILPFSFRANEWSGRAPSILGSFRPRHLADMLFPFFFGRPDLAENLAPAAFDNYPALLFTLAPGLLALALAGAGLFAGAGRDARRWALAALAAGLLLALGKFNPAIRALVELPIAEFFRFPAKFWLAGALGGSLLAGIGFAHVFVAGHRRPFGIALGALAAFYFASLLVALLAPAAVRALFTTLLSRDLPGELLDLLATRNQGMALLTLAAGGALALLLALSRRAPVVCGATSLALAAAFQLWLLKPALPMDDRSAYVAPPAPLAYIPRDAVVVNGGHHELFRPSTMLLGDYPDRRIAWLSRRSADELYPFAALLHGRRAELAISPEGLDSFLTQAVTVGLRGFSDSRRLDVLEALGVDRLLLDRELEPEAMAKVREIARLPAWGQNLHVYEPLERAAEVEVAGRIVEAPEMSGAMAAILATDFDPHRTAIVPGGGRVREGAGGNATIARQSSEEVELDVVAAADAVLFLRRAFLPIWRVEIDGVAARTTIVQLARLGVEVPAGGHRVRFWIDRRPLRFSCVVALLGFVLLWQVARRANGTIPPPLIQEPA